jgi:hypothetical protein
MTCVSVEAGLGQFQGSLIADCPVYAAPGVPLLFAGCAGSTDVSSHERVRGSVGQTMALRRPMLLIQHSGYIFGGANYVRSRRHVTYGLTEPGTLQPYAIGRLVLYASTASVVMLPLSAIGGALLALFLVYAIATRGGATPITTLLLAGIAVGSFLTAISSLLISINIVTWQVAQEHMPPQMAATP